MMTDSAEIIAVMVVVGILVLFVSILGSLWWSVPFDEGWVVTTKTGDVAGSLQVNQDISEAVIIVKSNDGQRTIIPVSQIQKIEKSPVPLDK